MTEPTNETPTGMPFVADMAPIEAVIEFIERHDGRLWYGFVLEIVKRLVADADGDIDPDVLLERLREELVSG